MYNFWTCHVQNLLLPSSLIGQDAHCGNFQAFDWPFFPIECWNIRGVPEIKIWALLIRVKKGFFQESATLELQCGV